MRTLLLVALLAALTLPAAAQYQLQPIAAMRGTPAIEAGTDGAFRLMANLLSLGRAPGTAIAPTPQPK